MKQLYVFCFIFPPLGDTDSDAQSSGKFSLMSFFLSATLSSCDTGFPCVSSFSNKRWWRWGKGIESQMLQQSEWLILRKIHLFWAAKAVCSCVSFPFYPSLGVEVSLFPTLNKKKIKKLNKPSYHLSVVAHFSLPRTQARKRQHCLGREVKVYLRDLLSHVVVLWKDPNRDNLRANDINALVISPSFSTA